MTPMRGIGPTPRLPTPGYQDRQAQSIRIEVWVSLGDNIADLAEINRCSNLIVISKEKEIMDCSHYSLRYSFCSREVVKASDV
jgi:hypothetical protein